MSGVLNAWHLFLENATPEERAKAATQGTFESTTITIDHDGNPKAYTVRGHGHDADGADRLDNASHGESYTGEDSLNEDILLKQNGKFVTREIDGILYYVPKTSWQDSGGKVESQTHEDFVDGSQVPYIAISSTWARKLGTKPGKGFFLIENLNNNRRQVVIIGDSRGGRGNSIEMSPAAATSLGIGFNRNGITSLNTDNPSSASANVRITFLGNAEKVLSVRNYQP